MLQPDVEITEPERGFGPVYQTKCESIQMLANPAPLVLLFSYHELFLVPAVNSRSAHIALFRCTFSAD